MFACPPGLALLSLSTDFIRSLANIHGQKGWKGLLTVERKPLHSSELVVKRDKVNSHQSGLVAVYGPLVQTLQGCKVTVTG